MIERILTFLVCSLGCVASQSNDGAAVGAGRRDPVKAFCIDFNWGPGGPNAFAAPGLWAEADPAPHVAWYAALGADVLQTFCVSCNGYAWYRGDVVPEQPGLQHDFLREVVRLGHLRGMRVMGYFCAGANTRWGQAHPELSYGVPAKTHIPYTDEYLQYLDAAVRDAVANTGIDGFMVDWLWQPDRAATGGRWLACETELYEQLMGHPFPGEDSLTEEQDREYGRRALDRCWATIHDAARQTRPDCIIWLSSHSPMHPHIVDSRMFREVDWLMNEGGDLERLAAIRPMIGEHTRLLTCLANWNRQDPTMVVPAALRDGIGLYGFTKPRADSLLPPVDDYLERPVVSLTGDERNIAALARAYRGLSLDAVKNRDGEFFTPAFRPMFDGQDLSGWSTAGNWVVGGDGTIALEPRPGESGWQRYDAYLTTGRTYGDFVLDLEFRFEAKGNSGVFLRVGDPASQVDTGIEVQILDTYGKTQVGHHDCGGVIRTVGPTKNMVRPAGEWNRYTITMLGSRLTVVLNGEQIVDIDLSETPMADRPARGHISFQDEAKRVWYRNVRIMELDHDRGPLAPSAAPPVTRPRR
ncbi:MAG: DUF1080 domain-containing protein [Planctomycetes bacterium]|nr:DUF1080 domain-containing protein [Planctomycetota bacterium]